MFAEFKKFIMRGNVMDMAVGIIIGAAFGLIIKSLVADVIMPPIGILMGQVDFSELQVALQPAVMEGDKVVKEAVSIRYGLFLNTVINFVIVGFAIFMMIRMVNKMQKAPPPADPTEKDCSFCQSKISIKATRCPHCTSELAAE